MYSVFPGTLKIPDPPQNSGTDTHAVAAPYQKAPDSLEKPEDDGTNRQEETDEMIDGLTNGDKGKPI